MLQDIYLMGQVVHPWPSCPKHGWPSCPMCTYRCFSLFLKINLNARHFESVQTVNQLGSVSKHTWLEMAKSLLETWSQIYSPLNFIVKMLKHENCQNFPHVTSKSFGFTFSDTGVKPNNILNVKNGLEVEWIIGFPGVDVLPHMDILPHPPL